MAKILFVGDPHLKISKFNLAKTFLSWLDEIVRLHKPNLVVNLGDTFDTHATVRTEIVGEYLKHVENCLKICPYVHLLGNHEMYKPKDATYHALQAFKNKYPNYHVVDEIQDLFDMTFVPYQISSETFPKLTLPICVAHQTFKGADFGTLVTMDGVDGEAVSADVIVSGHIHKAQILGKVIYPGSPFSQSASDVGQIKGLTLFDTDTYQYKFLACPLPIWRSASFSLKDQTHDGIIATMSEISKSEDHWLIDIEGSKAEVVALLSSKEYKKTIEGVDVRVMASFTDKVKKLTSIKSVTPESVFDDYIDNIYNGTLDKTILKDKMRELLENNDSKIDS